jgi:hypothetical protein
VASTAAVITKIMAENTAAYLLHSKAAVIITTATANIPDSFGANTVASKTTIITDTVAVNTNGEHIT